MVLQTCKRTHGSKRTLSIARNLHVVHLGTYHNIQTHVENKSKWEGDLHLQECRKGMTLCRPLWIEFFGKMKDQVMRPSSALYKHGGALDQSRKNNYSLTEAAVPLTCLAESINRAAPNKQTRALHSSSPSSASAVPISWSLSCSSPSPSSAAAAAATTAGIFCGREGKRCKIEPFS